MAYKINIRNQANDAWINLLEAQYIELTDTNSKFTATEVESALEELFDNKAQRISASAAPGASDDGYQIGSIWVNTTDDTIYVCADDSTGAAIWVNLSSTDTEGIEDIVGAMFTSNSETNITSTYNDTTGKIDLSVATATTSSLGVASFPATDFAVNTGVVTIAAGAIGATELASSIDATAIGFNAAQVDGADVNDVGTTTSDLWTAAKIKTYVDSVASGLSWQEPVISMDLNAPPSGTPSTGDRYVVSMSPSAASGAWLGHDNDVAEWDGAAWDYTVVAEGFALWNTEDDVQYVYNGASWAKIGTTITHSNLLGLQGGDGGDELYHLTSAEHSAIIGSKAANTVFASPDGSAGVGGFRALTATDIPLLTSAKISDFDEAAQDAYGALVSGGNQTNITVTYNDGTPSVDFSVAAATTTTLGVASFSSSNFSVAGGAVSLVAGGGLDHGDLAGKDDDDHTQYVHNTIARTITAQHTFAPATAIAPFALNANAQGVLVTGLNADLLNGQDWTVAATASAPSTPATNDVWIEITS